MTPVVAVYTFLLLAAMAAGAPSRVARQVDPDLCVDLGAANCAAGAPGAAAPAAAAPAPAAAAAPAAIPPAVVPDFQPAGAVAPLPAAAAPAAAALPAPVPVPVAAAPVAAAPAAAAPAAAAPAAAAPAAAAPAVAGVPAIIPGDTPCGEPLADIPPAVVPDFQPAGAVAPLPGQPAAAAPAPAAAAPAAAAPAAAAPAAAAPAVVANPPAAAPAAAAVPVAAAPAAALPAPVPVPVAAAPAAAAPAAAAQAPAAAAPAAAAPAAAGAANAGAAPAAAAAPAAGGAAGNDPAIIVNNPAAQQGAIPPAMQQIFAGPGLFAGGPGGIFWQSNDANQNVVFSANIDAFGNMTFAGAWATGGVGSHVLPNNVPNAFESQGSVKVVDDKLTVVNAGSNTISLYQIDFVNPAFIRPIGGVFDSQGDFPICTTIGQVNHNTCVVNAGARNTIACFTINLRSGLVPIDNTFRTLNLNLATPPVSGSGTPNEIFFNDVQTKLWVTVKNNGANPGMLLTYDVDPDTFALSDSAVITSTPTGTSLTQVKDGISIFTNAIGDGVAAFQIFDGPAAVQAPVAQPIVPIPGSIHNAWSEDSAVTGNYYMSDSMADQFTEIAVDPNTLVTSIVAQTPLPAGGFCMDEEICNLEARDTLYVLCAGSLTMEVFALNGPGDAVHQQTFDFAAAAQQAGVPLDSNFIGGTNCFQQG